MAGIVREAEAGPVVEVTVQGAEAGPVVVATVQGEVADQVAATAQVAADPEDGRAVFDEAGRATTAAERFAASVWTISST